MQLRQIELILPQNRRADAEEVIRNRKEVLSISVQPITASQRYSKNWEQELFLKDQFLIRILVPAEESEACSTCLRLVERRRRTPQQSWRGMRGAAA